MAKGQKKSPTPRSESDASPCNARQLHHRFNTVMYITDLGEMEGKLGSEAAGGTDQPVRICPGQPCLLPIKPA